MEGDTFLKQKYGFSKMAVGEVITVPVNTKREELNARKAAHNLNVRTDKYFITSLVDSVLHVARVR